MIGREDLPPATAPIDPVLPAETDVAAMQLTSGTTGFPRICVWRQHRVMAALDGMAEAMQVGAEDVYVNWTPLYHDMGLMNNFFLCLTRGIPLVMLSPFDFVKDPSVWLRAVHDTRATTTWSPNFGFALAAQRASDKKLEGVRLDHVRGFWNAAEKIHHHTLVEFEQRFRPYGLGADAVKTNFGCAENVGGATFTRLGEGYRVERVDAARLQNEQVAVEVGETHTGPTVEFVGCGVPHPGIKLCVVDPEGVRLPDGTVGELALDTPSAMDGYLDDPESTADAFVGDLLKTGDLGYVRGGEFFWTGRSRERIAVRGRKLDPSDFEAPLLQVEGLREGAFAAFGLDDEETGTEKVVLVAEVRDEVDDVEGLRGAVKRSVFERLGVGLDGLVLVEKGTLTKTSSGKRRHRHFKEMYLRGELESFEVARG
jgi:acyl-CoA synthetase (AMP-forming)/AMP-acid ligase II